MKLQLLVSALALGVATTASAVTINFNNGSGTYAASGITATVTAKGGPRFYNGLQPGGGSLGVGYTALDGGIGHGESLKVTFNQTVRLNSVSFTQWAGGMDEAYLSYTNGSKVFRNSLLNFDLIDNFSAGGILLDSFTITPKCLTSKFYLHGVDVAAVPVPAAAWLMGSGIAALAGLARRRKA